MMNRTERIGRAVAILRDAGGKVVGRTRLQKIAYLLELAGKGEGYSFRYRYYGPYSEELTDDVRLAWLNDQIDEKEKQANWGGVYSIFTLMDDPGPEDLDRAELAKAAAEIDAVALELAATAAFLKKEEGYDDPWGETAKRKPDKATSSRIKVAKRAYKELQATNLGQKLPALD